MLKAAQERAQDRWRGMGEFDWHRDEITRETPVDARYRNTQNVRRFLISQCGPGFRFDRAFMDWIKDGAHKTMGEVVDEWLRRRRKGAD